jgi:hypothetical protein
MLDGSRMLRRHVRFVRGFSPYATAWQAALTGGLEEPICQRTNTNLSALYWRLSAPTESEDDEKANQCWQKISAGLTTAYFRRTWQRSMWFNGKIVGGLTVRSLHAVYSSRIYSKHRTTIISNWHVIAELQVLCWRAHLMSRFRRLVQSEYRFLRYFTDVWNIHQQDDFIFRNVYSLF